MSGKLFDKRASDLIGKNVYDSAASFIGNVVDVKLSLEKGFALIVPPQGGNPGRELTIEADEIAVVKDTILLKTTREQQQRPCPECGHVNAAVARYCRECGTELSRADYALIRGAPNKDPLA